MPSSTAQVFEAALALSEDDRGKLTEQLVQSLDGQADPDAERAWGLEIEKRLAQHDAGTAQFHSMDESLQRIYRAARGR
jgi:putative addiction module component (TIGR02574 family)